jgi:hypothetical protein
MVVYGGMLVLRNFYFLRFLRLSMQRFVRPSQSSGATEIFNLYNIPSSDRGTVFQVIDKSTDIGRFITEDPEFIRNFVRQWDLIQFSGMSVSYVANRGWDGWMALREFIQNALDAEDVPEGKVDLDVNLEYGTASDGKPIIRIENTHGEIPYNAMILGVSEKPCWARGRFGEGLKLGMAWFASIFATPYIFSKRYAFKAIVLNNNVYFLLGLSRTYDRNVVLIYNSAVKPPKDAIVNPSRMPVVKAFYMDDKIFYGSCGQKRPFYIYRKPSIDAIGKLYSSQILVNDMVKIASQNSLYSYDVPYVRLTPDRNSVQSVYELKRAIALSLSHETVAYKLFDDLLEYAKYEGHPYDLSRGGLVELYLDYNPNDAAKAAIATYMNKLDMIWTHNAAIIDKLRYYGAKNIVLVNQYVSALLPESTSDKAFLRMKGDVLEQNMKGRVPLNELTMKERSVMEEVMALSLFVMQALYLDPRKMDVYPVEKLQDALGVHKGKEIVISRDVLTDPTDAIKVTAHEIAHAVGGSDISEQFERSLSSVASTIYSLGRITRDILRRKLSGYWAARKEIYDPTYEEVVFNIIQKDMMISPLHAFQLIGNYLSDYQTMIVIERTGDSVKVLTGSLDIETSDVGSVETIYRQYLSLYDRLVKPRLNLRYVCVVMFNWIDDKWEIFFDKPGYKPLSSIRDVIDTMHKSMVEWEKTRLADPFASVVKELGYMD